MPAAHHAATKRAKPTSTSRLRRPKEGRPGVRPALFCSAQPGPFGPAGRDSTTATAADARLPPVPCKGQPKVLLKGLRTSLRRLRWPVAAAVGAGALLVAFVVVAATVDRHALRVSVVRAAHDPAGIGIALA